MSDALRKEYTGTTGRSCFDTHGEPWPNYVYWLEASLLSEREKVKDLELRMNVAYWDGIKKDNAKMREKVARLTAENERMREAVEKLIDGKRPYKNESGVIEFTLGAWADFTSTVLREQQAHEPNVCRWTWNDEPYPGGWRTSCKNAHGNIDGKGKTPVGVCPYCGLPIEKVKE